MSLLMIPGPGGSLEARYHTSPHASKAPIVIIVPPHPEQEGSMDHPVVHALFRAFASLKFNVLRFNFRGCGKSHGVFSNGESEISDAAACLDWLQGKNITASQCWVAGFSFGAYIALQLLMRRPECHSFVAVSPPTNLYDFNFLAPCPSPGLVIHGEADDITPRDYIVRFVHQLSLQRRGHKITMHLLPQGDHVFSNQLKTVENLVHEYLFQELSSPLFEENSVMNL